MPLSAGTSEQTRQAHASPQGADLWQKSIVGTEEWSGRDASRMLSLALTGSSVPNHRNR